MRLSVAKLPEPSIELRGFPSCFMHGCGAEVAAAGDQCAAHPGGETPRDWRVLRRSLLRQMRGGVMFIQNCMECLDKPLNGIRCLQCTWTRGAVIGVAGIQEYYGWAKDGVALMDMIAIREDVPGTQRREGGRGAEELH